MDILKLIPEDSHEQGGKIRLNVRHEGGSTAVLLTLAEKDVLEAKAQQRGVSMSEVVRLAVRDFAGRLDPNGHADVPAMAAELGVPASKLAEIKTDPFVRFRGDLEFLAHAAGGVSLSRAARWAVAVYDERS